MHTDKKSFVTLEESGSGVRYGTRQLLIWVFLLLLVLCISCDVNKTLSVEKLFVAGWNGARSGFLWAGTSIKNLIVHPLLTIQGVEHAVSHRDIIVKEFMCEWRVYLQALCLDRIVFVKSTLMILSTLGLSVFSTQVLELYGGRFLGLAQHGAVSFSGSIMSSIMKRGRRSKGVLHQTVVLVRARNILSERHLNIHVTGIRKVWWRYRNLFNEGLQIMHMAIVKPLPCFVYCFTRLSSRLMISLNTLLVAMIRQLFFFAIPMAIIFQLWIVDTIRMQAIVLAGHQRIAPVVKRFRGDVEHLSLADLQIQTGQIQSVYQEYREQLLILYREHDQVLGAELNTLDKQVAERTILDHEIDARISAIFKQYTRRRLYLAEELVRYHAERPHNPLAPSRNWMMTYQDELTLFLDVQQKVGGEKSAFLQQIIDRLEKTILYIECITKRDTYEALQDPLPEDHESCGSIDEQILPGRSDREVSP